MWYIILNILNMWWIIIIGIVLIIIIKFTSDNNKQASAVAKQGGMRNKYKRLVDFALEGQEHSHIVREDGTSIVVGCSSNGGSTYIEIVQCFGDVVIRWCSNSIVMGTHKLEWKFNEFYDQDKIVEKINHDIEVYMANVIQKYH